ncbi:uncharacterized protein LOC114516786 [Dendronephthya gigantea]|uniref:uncharacterized protein LOC114516786 n=1 Tax=Dendronephthya gigantea TaxID=151771 RepID=UPI001069290B|nr:uncharacterized protein LOC114516786 [Dendronephthya gigantea]
MTALLSVILFCLWGSSISHQEDTRRTSKLTEAPVSNRASTSCLSDADCIRNEYCHDFYRVCLRQKRQGTAAPVSNSRKGCSEDSHCKMTEYCHNFWKICLPAQAVQVKRPPTQRPSWYCRTSKDCRITEQCHRRFHACYTRPAMSTVRRDVGGSRKCVKTSDCGQNFYCHDHFKICLKNVTTVTTVAKPKTKTTKPCGSGAPCPNGMLCHNFWNICYMPPQVVTTPPKNKTKQCQIDSDCRSGEFCYTMTIGQVVARLRRNVQSVCLPKKSPKNKKVAACKTDADCGPNKCCLGNLGVCMAYKLPGEMCLMAKNVDFVCPCTSGSYCKTKQKWVSPRRIINKMKLPQKAANHLLRRINRKKHKAGKCTPSSF